MTVDERAGAPTARSGSVADRRRLGLQLALATAFVSGVAVYVNGQAVRRFPSPTVYTTGKNLVAGAVLVVVLLAASSARRPARETGWADRQPVVASVRRRLAVAAVAVGGGAVAFVLFFEGLAQATSTDAAFIHKTLVVWASCLAVVVLRERIGPAQLAAIAALVAGHVALADGITLRPGAGEAMILAATLIWSVEVVAVKRLLADIGAPAMAAARVGGGSLVLVAWLASTGDLRQLVDITAAQVGWLVVTGCLLATFVTCWYHALAHATVVDVTAILVVGAVVTGVLDVVVGHAPAGARPSGWLLILLGAAVVVGRSMWMLRPAPDLRTSSP